MVMSLSYHLPLTYTRNIGFVMQIAHEYKLAIFDYRSIFQSSFAKSVVEIEELSLSGAGLDEALAIINVL